MTSVIERAMPSLATSTRSKDTLNFLSQNPNTVEQELGTALGSFHYYNTPLKVFESALALLVSLGRASATLWMRATLAAFSGLFLAASTYHRVRVWSA